MKKTIIKSLFSVLAVLVFSFFVTSTSFLLHGADTVNPSVTLKPAPEIIHIEEQEIELVFEVPAGGYVPGSAGESQTFTPSTKLEFDADSLVISSLADAETNLENEELKEEMEIMLEMFDTLSKERRLSNILDYDKLTQIMQSFEMGKELNGNDFTVFNMFDIWFPGSEQLRNNDNPKISVTFCLYLDLPASGIYSLVQYNGNEWTIIDPSNITAFPDGTYNVTLTRMAPIALLSISDQKMEEILNPYLGEVLPEVLGTFSGAIVIEGGVLLFMLFKKRKLLSSLFSIGLFGVQVATSSVIIMIAQIIVMVLLALAIVNLHGEQRKIVEEKKTKDSTKED